MFLVTPLAYLVLLGSTVSTNPIVTRNSPISLPFSRYMDASGTGCDSVQSNQERTRSFMKQRSTSASEITASVGVTNTGYFYTASVGIGAPPTYYNLMVDTGSSNTWIGAGKQYVRTKTSIKTSDRVASDSYGNGALNDVLWFIGDEYIDTVTMALDLVISQQSISVATTSVGFEAFRGVDGFLGLGPADLTIGSLYPDLNASIPTVTDNLFSSGAIPSNIVSVSFEPMTETFMKNGELTFGDTNSSKFIEPITYAPLTTSIPANTFWAIDLSIQYGDSVPILHQYPCVVDTGTTLVLFPTDAFNSYRAATGAVFDPETQIHRITAEQFGALKSLFFTIGGREFEFTPNAQIWPRALNGVIGGRADSIYLIINDSMIDSQAENGIGCSNGYSFLERYYTVFDTTNQCVGFATTQFTTENSN